MTTKVNNALPEYGKRGVIVQTAIHSTYVSNLRQNRPEYVINMGESCTQDNRFETSFCIICQVVFFSMFLPLTITDDFNFPEGGRGFPLISLWYRNLKKLPSKHKNEHYKGA
jgi:hypothetical protein